MDEDRDLTTAQLLSMGFDLDAINTAYTLSEDFTLESLLTLLTSSLFTPPPNQSSSIQPAKKLPPPQQKSYYPSYIYSSSFQTPQINSKHSESSSNEWEDEGDEYNLEEDMAVDILDMEHIVLVEPDRDRIHTLDKVIQEIYNELQEVSETLGVSLGHAALIMKNNQWNSEKVMEKFFENPESIMVYAPYQRGSYNPESSEKFTCPICLTSDIPKHSVFALECRHAFCVECWRMYIEELINSGDSESLRCMETSCSEVLLDTDFIKRIVSESEFRKYLKFWVNKFIDSHPLWTFCPQPGCECLFKSDGISLLRCYCGFTFCSKCHKEAHYPAACTEMEKWRNGMKNARMTVRLIIG